MVLPLVLALQTKVPQIQMGTSPTITQYGYLRATQESGEKPELPGVMKAVDALSGLEKTFPAQIKTRTGTVVTAATSGQPQVNALYWRTLDALVFSSGNPDLLTQIPQAMPKIGGELDTEPAVRTILEALKSSGSDFERTLWPKMSAESNAQREAFTAIPATKRDGAMKFMIEKAGIANPPEKIDVIAVPRMAGKEGMTVRGRQGLLVVIGTAKYQGGDFAEVVLHESTHVLDTLGGDRTLFARLRTALREAGRPALEIEQVPHVCMFLMAAEAVRRNIDPKHKDVGETFGAYSRGLEPFRKVVELELAKLYNGQGIDETVVAIVAKLKGS